MRENVIRFPIRLATDGKAYLKGMAMYNGNKLFKANRVLHYDVEKNVMRDENEYIVFNIFAFITPNDLMFFKQNKENMITSNRFGQKVTLLYME